MVERLVHFAADPETMEKDRQLPGDADDGSLLPQCRTACRNHQSPASQIAIDSEGPKNILGTLDQKRPQVQVFAPSSSCWTHNQGDTRFR
jgi:hypothetical protein